MTNKEVRLKPCILCLKGNLCFSIATFLSKQKDNIKSYMKILNGSLPLAKYTLVSDHQSNTKKFCNIMKIF